MSLTDVITRIIVSCLNGASHKRDPLPYLDKTRFKSMCDTSNIAPNNDQGSSQVSSLLTWNGLKCDQKPLFHVTDEFLLLTQLSRVDFYLIWIQFSFLSCLPFSIDSYIFFFHHIIRKDKQKKKETLFISIYNSNKSFYWKIHKIICMKNSNMCLNLFDG